MRKRSISVILCIIMVLLSGCKEKNVSDTSDIMLPIEDSTSPEEYMEFLRTLPINEEDISNYIGGEIVSNEVIFDEEDKQYINRIKYIFSYSQNNFYTIQSYAMIDLEMSDDGSEWQISEHNREHHSRADLDITTEILEDNISGQYEIYETSNIKSGQEIKIQAKIDEWEILGDTVYGYMNIDVYNDWGITINCNGYLQGYDLNIETDYSQQIDLNWEFEEDGYKYTNINMRGRYMRLFFKDETQEILLLEGDNWQESFRMFTLKKITQ